MTDDFWRFGGACEEGEADLPGGAIGSNLGEEFDGLGFEVIVGGGVPSNLDGILDLHKGVSSVLVNSCRRGLQYSCATSAASPDVPERPCP